MTNSKHDSAHMVLEILKSSGLSKSAFCARAQVSRSLVDAYLKGVSQPTLGQLNKLASAAGFRIQFELQPKGIPLPEGYVELLEFGEIFPTKAPPPLVNLGPIWRAARERKAA